MVHPSKQSIDEVWKHFTEAYITANDQVLAKKIHKLQASKEHRKLNENKEELAKLENWMKNQEKEIEQLLALRKKNT
jgi:hypothetical protein